MLVNRELFRRAFAQRGFEQVFHAAAQDLECDLGAGVKFGNGGGERIQGGQFRTVHLQNDVARFNAGLISRAIGDNGRVASRSLNKHVGALAHWQFISKRQVAVEHDVPYA